MEKVIVKMNVYKSLKRDYRVTLYVLGLDGEYLDFERLFNVLNDKSLYWCSTAEKFADVIFWLENRYVYLNMDMEYSSDFPIELNIDLSAKLLGDLLIVLNLMEGFEIRFE